MNILYSCIIILYLIFNSSSEEYRSYNGENNNLLNPLQGSINQPFIRILPPLQFNSSGVPNIKLQSPRVISNIVFDQNESIPSKENLTQLFYIWGQFLTHNIALTIPPSSSSNEPIQHWPIIIPKCDKYYDPKCSGNKTMYYDRTIKTNVQCGKGITTVDEDGKCYEQVNGLSSYIDAEVIYSSREDICTNLRTLQNGRMKMTLSQVGDLPPTNVSGVPVDNDSNIFPTSQLFSLGERRGNENPGLLSLHTLFLREHNRMADKYSKLHPYWDDETIFQHSRSCVIEQIQKITYNEYLPILLGPFPSYNGYNPKINTQVSNEFSTAAFRFGHSLVGSNIEYYSENATRLKPLPLKFSYFNPHSLNQGIEPIIRGLVYTIAENIDTFYISDLRNFLFGKPGQGGYDLASRNIQRSRDHGIPSYNSLRKQLGLKIATNWSDITSDKVTQYRLKQAYKSIDDVEAYVGGLAEDHMDGSCVGQLFYSIIFDQFYRTRAGDRFWYESLHVKMFNHECETTTLSQLIKRTTSNIGNIPSNVFKKSINK